MVFLLQTTNTEMFWVISEICLETNIAKRVKLLKYYIKVASKQLLINYCVMKLKV